MVVILKPAVSPKRVPARFLADGERPVILVGVGGPSGCGKTTLTRELVNRLGTPLGSICADNFYDHAQAPMEKRTVWGKSKWERNLEDPDAIDTKLLISELRRVGRCLADEKYAPDKVILQTPLDSCVNLTKRGKTCPGEPLGADPIILLVEGFLLYHDAEVAGACSLRLWIDIDCGTAMRRRYKRDGDPDCEIDDHFTDWYEKKVWPNYEKHRARQLDNADGYDPAVFRIDGSQSCEHMLDETLDYLNMNLKSGGICRPRKEINLRPRKRIVDDSRERCADEGVKSLRKSGRYDITTHRKHANGRRNNYRREASDTDEEERISNRRRYREREDRSNREENGRKPRRMDY